MKKKIAITLQNFVQFYSVKSFLDLKKYDVDIYVPDGDKYDLGVKSMHDDIYKFLVENKYMVYRNVRPNVKYQILLEPYPMDIYFKFDYKYRIKYKYASISAKPKITYNIPECILYDAIFCHSTYEQEVMDCFTKTFLVGRLCFNDFKRKNNNKKKVILYLPTYGDYNYIDDVVEELIKLSTKYDIITKEHHGTNYLYSENQKSEKLRDSINIFYDSTYPLAKLLEIADVVLTDNSGSIFEALYTKVPVCIFSKDIDGFDFNNLTSLQNQLVKEAIIPFTCEAKGIEKIIIDALSNSYIEKQKKASDVFFPIKYEDSLESFMCAIDCFINENDRNLKNRIILHREVQKYYNSIIEENNKLVSNAKMVNESLDNLNNNNNILKNRLSDYENGKLYRLSTIIYLIMSKVRRKK